MSTLPPVTGIPSLYTGVVATRGQLANQGVGASVAASLCFRTTHFMRDSVSSFQCVWGNWYTSGIAWNTVAEAVTGSNAVITASIEYPLGVIAKQITFGGSPSGALPSGAQIVSDPINLAIPNGAQFWVRMYWVGAAGGWIAASNQNAAPTDATELNGTDKTMSGTVVNNSPNYYLPPLAIIGKTRRPSIFLAGDSIQFGTLDAVGNVATRADGAVGIFARNLSGSFGYIQAGRNFDSASQAVGNYVRRGALARAYCSHIATNYGNNDYVNGQTAAQVAVNRTAFAALFPGMPVIGATMGPFTTSSDAWATPTIANPAVNNQTVTGTEAVRLTLNGLIRAGIAGEGPVCVDIADFFETSRNSGFWLAPGFTTEGQHPVDLGSTRLQQSAAVNPGLFFR